MDYLSILYGFIGGVVFILTFQRFFRLELREPRYLKFYMPNGMRDGYLELPIGMADRMMPMMPSIPFPRSEKEKPKGEAEVRGNYL